MKHDGQLILVNQEKQDNQQADDLRCQHGSTNKSCGSRFLYLGL